MKKIQIFYLIFLLLCSVNVACKSQRPEEAKEVTKESNEVIDQAPVPATESTPSGKQPGPIEEKGLGEIQLGMSINEIDSQLTKKDRVESQEGESYTYYQFLKDGELLFEISPNGDGQLIEEITVFSPRFKTEQKIGVGSTLKEFLSACQDYTLNYTYVSERYFLTCKNTGDLQFQLDPVGYQGKPITPKSDIKVLKPENFKEDTKITAVRIF